MMFNTDKCKSLHFGNKNVKSVYLLGDKFIRADEEENDLDLRVIIYTKSLKTTSQCVAAPKSANKTLGMISRTFVNEDTHIMLRLFILVFDQTETGILCASMEVVFKEGH